MCHVLVKDRSSNHCRELNVAITLRRDDQQPKQDSCCSNGPETKYQHPVPHDLHAHVAGKKSTLQFRIFVGTGTSIPQ
jgi:hypothetical protein